MLVDAVVGDLLAYGGRFAEWGHLGALRRALRLGHGPSARLVLWALCGVSGEKRAKGVVSNGLDKVFSISLQSSMQQDRQLEELGDRVWWPSNGGWGRLEIFWPLHAEKKMPPWTRKKSHPGHEKKTFLCKVPISKIIVYSTLYNPAASVWS